jgi:hypothetical protein
VQPLLLFLVDPTDATQAEDEAYEGVDTVYVNCLGPVGANLAFGLMWWSDMWSDDGHLLPSPRRASSVCTVCPSVCPMYYSVPLIGSYTFYKFK